MVSCPERWSQHSGACTEWAGETEWGPYMPSLSLFCCYQIFRCSDILLHSLMKVSSLCLRIVPDAKSLPFGTICIFKFIL